MRMLSVAIPLLLSAVVIPQHRFLIAWSRHARLQPISHSSSMNCRGNRRGNCPDGSMKRLNAFLERKAFKVLNEPRLGRERNLAPRPLKFNIDAVDEHQRTVSIGSNGFIAGSYFLHFHSPPPTRHSEAMEEGIFMFFSDVLGCRERGIVRKKNGPEASAYYAEVFKVIRNRVREANGEL